MHCPGASHVKTLHLPCTFISRGPVGEVLDITLWLTSAGTPRRVPSPCRQPTFVVAKRISTFDRLRIKCHSNGPEDAFFYRFKCCTWSITVAETVKKNDFSGSYYFVLYTGGRLIFFYSNMYLLRFRLPSLDRVSLCAPIHEAPFSFFFFFFFR